jgi:hypothetical protein
MAGHKLTASDHGRNGRAAGPPIAAAPHPAVHCQPESRHIEEVVMPVPRRALPRLGENVRRKVEVAAAMAWEALVDTHTEQADHFITAMADHLPLEEALPRYLSEMDIGNTMATAVRTRVLLQFEERPMPQPRSDEMSHDDDDDSLHDEPGDGWRLLRQPRRMVQGVRDRQRRSDELDRIMMLALARAEERVIGTHVENAIGYVALLEEHMSLDRCVQQYLGAVGLAGGRAQTVFQRTMARLADVHLPA